MAEFAKLLDALGRDPAERVSLCVTTDRFRPVVTTVAEAPDIAATLTEVDCWYGANPLHDRVPATEAKGYARDVVGVRELYGDLDVKAGGMGSYEAAQAVIVDLAGMLGEYPAAIVSSGHGLQPHWAVEKDESSCWPDETDDRWRVAVALMRRWHRLVLRVAEAHGGGVDNVSNLDRILRVPGTTNCKADPVPVTVEFPGGAPVTLERLAETLEEYGVPVYPEDSDVLGDVVSEPGSWEWAEQTCRYVAAMVKAWAGDTPAGRHPWLMSQAVRLAAAHRAGCLTQGGHAEAVERLTARFHVLTGPGTPPRPGGKTGPAAGEIREALSWGVARVATFPTVKHCVDNELGGHVHLDIGDPVVVGEDEGAGNVYDWFWAQRPILAHVHDFARARRVSPWAVLGVVLVRVCAVIPPFVVLPALVGSQVSLNTYVGFVGRSGAGKDSAINAAADAVKVGAVTIVGVGSGEGIAHQYVSYKRPNPKTGEAGGLEQHTTSVVFDAAEVETLAALKGRQASTLLPELRKAWTGTALGFAYVDREKRLKLAAHAYRLGLVVGIQPEKAGPLLGDADAGTPQRFLWLPAEDRDAPDSRPAEPDPMVWQMAAWPMATSAGRVVLKVCQAARDTIDTARLARLRGDGDALDGHALLCRLKTAALLGIIDGRAEVTEDDWTLAGVILAKSEWTRGQVVRVLADARRDADRARGKQQADRAVMEVEAVTDAAVKRVCRTITRKLGDGAWWTRGDLRKSLTSADRGYLDAAIDRLVEAGQVEAEHTSRGGRFRLVEGAS